MVLSLNLFLYSIVGLILSFSLTYTYTGIYGEDIDFIQMGETIIAKEPFYKSVNGTNTLTKSLNENGLPQNEISFFENSLINGNISVVNQGTFIDTLHPNNLIVGKGHGVLSSFDGQKVTWNAEDIGKITSNGTTVYQGLIYFDTDSSGSLNFLKGSVGLYLTTVENDGSQRNIWEWKTSSK